MRSTPTPFLAGTRSLRRGPSETRSASEPLLGQHDFTSFCVCAHERENRECDLFTCAWHKEEEGLRLEVAANRFLRGMVRGIVGTLVQVGRGTRPVDDIPGILAARDRSKAGPAAPAKGLTLKRVIYD